MAHVVGVPRRDPCQKCQLPVFLAERLVIGKNVFHRTCLKCARCGSQLTPGSFYETEVNNEYCCETCPDEEEQLDTKVGYREVDTPLGEKQSNVKTVRNSLSDRLAFFEQNAQATAGTTTIGGSSHRVLEKSVSDEEKRQRMGALAALQQQQQQEQKVTASRAPATSYKGNAALSTFLQDTIDGNELKSPEDEGCVQDDVSQTDTQGTSAALSDAEEEEDDEPSVDSLSVDAPPPALPQTKPPTAAAAGETSVSPLPPVASPRFTTKAEVRLMNADAAEQVSTLSPTPSPTPRGIQEEQTQSSNDSVPMELKMVIEPTTDEQQKERTKTNEAVDVPAIDISPEVTERLHVVSAQLRVIKNEANEREKVKDTNDDIIKKEEKSEEARQLPEASDSVEDVAIKQDASANLEPELSPIATTATPTSTPAAVEKEDREENDNDVDQEDVKKVNNKVPSVMETKDNDDLVKNILENTQIIETEAVTMAEETTTATTIIPKTSETETEQLNKEEETTAKVEEAVTKAQTKTDDVTTTTVAANQQPDYPESLNPFGSDDDDDEDEHHGDVKGQDKESPISERNTNDAMTNNNSQQQQVGLNPFDSSDDEVELEKKANKNKSATMSSASKVPPPRPPPPRIVRNPFGECDDEDHDADYDGGMTGQTPQREMQQFQRRSSLTSSLGKRGPLPTPRTSLTQSQTPTPEPTPRMSQRNGGIGSVGGGGSKQIYDSTSSLNTTPAATTTAATSTPATTTLSPTMTPASSIQRDADVRGSNNSLASSAGGTVRSRKSRRAPAPPPVALKELFPSASDYNSSNNASMATTPSSSRMGSPKSSRKKRPAPAPPKPARLDAAASLLLQQTANDQENRTTATTATTTTTTTDPKNSFSYPLQSEFDSKLSDEEKALLEGKRIGAETDTAPYQRIIPLDDCLLLSDADDDDPVGKGNVVAGDANAADERSDDHKQQKKKRLQEEETNVVYRRILVPNLETPTHDGNPLLDKLGIGDDNDDVDDDATNTQQYVHNRQLEKLKDNKEAQNRNRQSQISISPTHFDGSYDGSLDASAASYYNKSQHGKWKRRKGPAPALPIPPRKVLQKLPLQEIRHELEIIEVQQQGLEKQGVILEKMIRDRCEGQTTNVASTPDADQVDDAAAAAAAGGRGKEETSATEPQNVVEQVQNSKEVEDLILQLFELVNEKNELFRRQAELMYLRRQHRLEQEQADIEYEIRVLMGQPERNKTDTDKSREEALIARLVELVELRNEVIDCLEMDRLREAEEDLSIKQRLELHNAKRESSMHEKHKSGAKLSKKEKKQQKEAKKLSKSKKLDADKDADETELKMPKDKSKKKRKLFF